MSKYMTFMKTIRTIIPNPVLFKKEYSNPCWTAPINISAMYSIKMLRRLHFAKQLPKSAASNMYNNVMMLGKRENTIHSLICLPRVFLPSFPKCGSTLLYRLVTFHPLIRKPRSKECHWWTRFPFSLEHPYDKLSTLSYLTQFKRGTLCSSKFSQCLVVDGSQSLIWDTRRSNDMCMVPHLMRAVLPDSKFIVIMRNPVFRLYSEYWYFSHSSVQSRSDHNQVAKSPEHFHLCVLMLITNFQKCLQMSSVQSCAHSFLITKNNFSHGCRVRLGVGIYYAHIARWLQFFPRDQFLFLRLEDLSFDLDSTMKKVWNFLNIPHLDPHVERNLLMAASKKSTYPSILLKSVRVLEQFYRPYNQKLAELINHSDFLWYN